MSEKPIETVFLTVGRVILHGGKYDFYGVFTVGFHRDSEGFN